MLRSADNRSEWTQSDGTGTQCFGGGSGGAVDSDGESGTLTLAAVWRDFWRLIDAGVGRRTGTWQPVKHTPHCAPSWHGAPSCGSVESCSCSAAPPKSCTSTAHANDAASKWKTRMTGSIRRMSGRAYMPLGLYCNATAYLDTAARNSHSRRPQAGGVIGNRCASQSRHHFAACCN
jgi:hypothetical protein